MYIYCRVSNRAYKFRLYPNKSQEDLLQKHFGHCRFIYNHFLSVKIKHYKETGDESYVYSQDTWIFCPEFFNITTDKFNFTFGTPGCDNYFLVELSKQNILTLFRLRGYLSS